VQGARLAFGLGLGKEKVEFTRCGITIHLLRPAFLVTRGDPGGEAGKIRRCQPLDSLLNFW